MQRLPEVLHIALCFTVWLFKRPSVGSSYKGIFMRRALLVILIIAATTAAPAAPAAPMETPEYQRCFSANFRYARVLLERIRAANDRISAELGNPNPNWTRLRSTIVRSHRYDVAFRQENNRVELICLDKLAPGERVASLRSQYRTLEPPPITAVQPR